MQETLRRMREKRAGGDHGFTLIELLVVVVIIGILVAIAIPVYLSYRKGAENRSAQSDLRNAITSVEQCYADNGNVYPAPAAQVGSTVTLLCPDNSSTQVVNMSANNTLVYAKVAGPPMSYTLQVTNSDTGKVYHYDSATGQMT